MDQLFVHGKKRFSDGEVSNQDARKISGELGFNHPGARREFEKSLHGSVTREKIHDKLQEMVASGKITEKKARSVVNQLGVERKDLRTFRDISEYRAIHKNETARDGSRATTIEQTTHNVNNNLNREKKNDSGAKKAASIWGILNSAKKQ